MRVDVLIAGVDRTQSKQLEQNVRQALAELAPKDVSTIALLPSDARGKWDLGVKKGNDWSVVWFDSEVEELSIRVTHNLRQSIVP
jgi:hypothetical protein